MKKILTAALVIVAALMLALYIGGEIYTQSGEGSYDTIQQFNAGSLENKNK